MAGGREALLLLLLLLLLTCTSSTAQESKLARSDTCDLSIECTASGDSTNYTGCQPERIQKTKWLFIANAVLVIIVGSLGNLLTLCSFIYARCRYQTEFPWLQKDITILILHLTTCDLLCCLLSLPFYVSIFYNGHFNGSFELCVFSAALRNWMFFAGIFTIVAIALTRSFGLVTGSYKRSTQNERNQTHWGAVCCCIFIWILAFLVICPFLFDFTIGDYSFGQFGYDTKKGRCEIICSNTGLKSGIVLYIYAIIIPFFIVIGSYLTIGFIVRREIRAISSGLEGNETQIRSARIHTTILVLCLVYTAFCFPILLVDSLLSDDFYTMLVYCWCWWMYAINPFVYMATSQDIRHIYTLFLRDTLGLLQFNISLSDSRAAIWSQAA